MTSAHHHRTDRLHAAGWLLLHDVIDTTSYRRPTAAGPSLAGESDGAYDASFDPEDPGPADGSPLPGLLDALDRLEQIKREVVDRYRDVTAWGGTANTTGYTRSEYVALVGRLSGREEWKLDLLASRLPASPVTAALLDRGQISVDQAITILSGTKRLSGDDLQDVERAAAFAALDRNRRGDDPDCETDVDLLVRETRSAAEQDRRERDQLERNSVRIQPDLFGAGRITEDWADPVGFQTRVAAIDHAAGQPAPDTPRGTQLAEGSLATARAWLAGADKNPAAVNDTPFIGPTLDTTDVGESAVTDSARQPAATNDSGGPAGRGDGLVDLDRPANWWGLPASPAAVHLGPSSARPTIVVRVDIKDLDGLDPDDPDTLQWLGTGSKAAMGRIASAARLSTTPWLGRQLLDTLACNTDLLVAVVDGERPLAEFRRTNRLPDRIRRQILWRDMGCRWPSCRAPIAHVDVHHLDEDPTNHEVDNLLALCRRHHIRLHSTFWHWRLDGHTGRFDLLRSEHGQPVHTTHPNGTPPATADPPEVAAAR